MHSNALPSSRNAPLEVSRYWCSTWQSRLDHQAIGEPERSLEGVAPNDVVLPPCSLQRDIAWWCLGCAKRCFKGNFHFGVFFMPRGDGPWSWICLNGLRAGRFITGCVHAFWTMSGEVCRGCSTSGKVRRGWTTSVDVRRGLTKSRQDCGSI
ncbi:hypothetical protein DEO72_LG11g2155 [Vigna unguiculata]|uniref:Uncharacterized protein n=1 Tax=Vigna unguiculata TaxID=3917 RepID=A0A4D6NNE4_VIGUN|nr:hypothetical protein DEO72_LG11g2155 [Vigna unguiculata]